jgi:small subunit ribosomal protein S1
MSRATAANLSEDNIEDFAALLEDYIKRSEKKEGEVVAGLVTGVSADFITIDVGLKSEGRIPTREFTLASGQEMPRVGDEIEVYIDKLENRNGEAILSYEKVLREKTWTRLENALETAEKVNGIIFGRVKGGFTVDLGGAVAFLPGSQVDIRPVKEVDPLIGVEQPFIILKMDKKRGNIVVSRRAIMEESRSEQRSELLGKISEGVTLEGVVKNITDYGVFMDLGGVDGLLHITDISWRRINHPSEVLKVGQTIKVMVTKYNQDTKRVSLGLKQLEENPWVNANSRFPVGSRHVGRVTNITEYGAFVEINPGIEGLVHVSEMSWTKKNVPANQIIALSQEVEVMIIDIDEDKHRLSLGIKQCQENPWAKFASENPVGTKIRGEIRSITDFGLFIALTDDLDGLIHTNDLSWTEKGDVAIKKYKKGDVVDAVVIESEPDKERFALGIKQLSADPLAGELEKIKKGEAVTSTITAIREDGVEVELPGGIRATIKKAELARDKAERRPERFAVGERVDAKVTAFDRDTRKVTLSIRALEVEEEKRAIAEYGSADSGASLGDILGAALKEGEDKA